MNVQKQEFSFRNLDVLDFFVLFLLGIFSAGYALGFSTFAEIHIDLPFLNFPIFIGEVLLVSVGILLGAKWVILKQNFTHWHYLLFLYVGWFLIKALTGYYIYGPLALRNAALFYYPLFAVVSYNFYLKRNLNLSTLILLWLVSALLIASGKLHIYFWWPCYLLTLVVAFNFKIRWFKIITLAVSLMLFRYDFLFDGPRNHLLGCLVSVLFLSFSVFFALVRMRLAWKVLINIIVIIGLFLGATHFADKNALKSMTTPQEIVRRWQELNVLIGEREDKFFMMQFPVQLYNKNRKTPEQIEEYNALAETNRVLIDGAATLVNETAGGVLSGTETELGGERARLPKEKSIAKEKEKARSLYIAHSNILFRLFIWRDMIVELIGDKAVFGMSLGYPQRSTSLEILGWAETEWMRDGWITPHNSYLHVLYRAGILGIIFLFVFCYCFVYMVRRVIKLKSFPGILLISIFVYWLVIANFLVFFEMPYHAIPFWSLFGVSLAYLKSQDPQKEEKATHAA